MDTIIPPPSAELMVIVRAGFVRNYTTLSAWCRRRGVKRENARKALLGEWNGPKAQALREEMFEAAASRIAS